LTPQWLLYAIAALALTAALGISLEWPEWPKPGAKRKSFPLSAYPDDSTCSRAEKQSRFSQAVDWLKDPAEN